MKRNRPAFASASGFTGAISTALSYSLSAPTVSPVYSRNRASARRGCGSFGLLSAAACSRAFRSPLLGVACGAFPDDVWPGRRAPSAAARDTAASTANATTPATTRPRRRHGTAGGGGRGGGAPAGGGGGGGGGG